MARSPGRRDDRYYARDRHDDRSYRRRSRSRDRDRRRDDRDRDYDRRRDRSHDRYHDSRGPRRDRSREPGRLKSPDRKRPREISPVRDRRSDGDRHRDDRDRYDDRDTKRSRRDDDVAGQPRRSEVGGRRDGGTPNAATVEGADSREQASKQLSSPTRPSAASEEADKLAKLAKLSKVEAWKKRLEEKKRQEAGLPGDTSPLANTETSTQASASPRVGSPALAVESPTDSKPASPGPYAGKFDPKAIAKRAAAAMEKQKSALGGDVVIHKSAPSGPAVIETPLADNSKAAKSSYANGRPTTKLGDARISGFDLSRSAPEKQDRSAAPKTAAPLDDEEQVERKLERLPDMPIDDISGDAALANDLDDQDEGDELDSDEEGANEAARQAAQKRAEEAQAGLQDVVMANGDAERAPASTTEGIAMDEDEEIDPLDAFMNSLEQPSDVAMPASRGRRHPLQVFNGDDDEDVEAVGNDDADLLTLAAKRKRKDIATVDHTKVQYEDIRKNFYSESVELAEMDEEEIAILRADLDNITLRGEGVPTPILKWAQGGFGQQILDVIRDMKFDKPTSIQSQALPAIMCGRDVIGVAKTGSGKTVAFMLPMLRHIKDQRPLENMDGPIGLILAPTRELATQIHRDCKPYLKALNLRAVCAYGGAPIKDQIAELKRGAEIVVCTPGRFIDLLSANNGRVTNVKRVTYVVLDEADRMFDMGFEPQIAKILANVRPQRQTVLFSATFPRKMESLARKALNKPIEITVGGRSVVAPEITQIIEIRDEGSKFRRTLELLGDLHDRDEDARSLIFVERQETADHMFVDLTRKGYPCVPIHGGRDQMDRDAAISDFKAGITPVMVATSVAARGLDVKQLKLVINFDSPNHIEDYVHRVGRTGRAGNTGTAVTYVTPQQDRYASFLIKALTDAGREVPEDLTKLEEAHKAKVKAGEAQKSSNGFGGRGIERLDAARDAQRAVERGQYKTGDEPEEEEQKDEKKEAKEKEFEKLLAKATAGVKDRDAQPEPAQQTPQTQPQAAAIPTALSDHLSNAMKVQKAERPAATSNDPLAKVAAAAAGINSRLGSGSRTTARPGVPADNRGPDAGAFHATLEINDFPQKARWSVTNRTNVAKILDATGTSITTKGNYYPAGRDPEPGGQPKLYILVEGDTEVQVTTAMTDLTRLLKEGTVAALDSEARAPASGRYSVV